MPNVPLRETAIITLSGSGGGTAKLGPLSAREIWHPDTATVSANSNPTNEATCQIFVGDANTLNLRDTTFTGSSGDNSGKVSADVVKAGQYVWAVWTGGDAGQQAKLTVTGTKDI